MSSRAGFRLFSNARFVRGGFAQRFGGARRTQATDAAAAAAPAAQQGMLAKLWNSPVGVKTVHFWYVEVCELKRIEWLMGLIGLRL